MQKKSALIVVDVQNDFCPGGALGVRGGDQIVPVLNRYIEKFSRARLPIFATRDWHPAKTTHFKAYGGMWPVHCVQGSRGAEFHADLKLAKEIVIISTGMAPDEEGYSGFQGRDASGTPLATALRDCGVDRIFVGGLATDYCVKYTVLDGLQHGFRAVVLGDAIRGVDLDPNDSRRALNEMSAAGAVMLVSFDDLRVQ
jgi:nicotinamidase/pyrazinamidase